MLTLVATAPLQTSAGQFAAITHVSADARLVTFIQLEAASGFGLVAIISTIIGAVVSYGLLLLLLMLVALAWEACCWVAGTICGFFFPEPDAESEMARASRDARSTIDDLSRDYERSVYMRLFRR